MASPRQAGPAGMNINLLIDAVVRQTTVLIAQLATAAGARASLAQTANQVFLNLVRELKDQGLTNSLIADMFGLSLRTYHNKMRRLSESSTDRGRSLWDAVLSYLRERKLVRRAEVLERFSRDDEVSVCSVLADLVDTGLILQGGKGDHLLYRAVEEEDGAVVDPSSRQQAIASLVWITVARHHRVSRGRLREALSLDDPTLDAAIGALTADGRVAALQAEGGIEYQSNECVIPMGDSIGWEASVFDHYQALVTAICTKLRRGTLRAVPGEALGGSTYGFEVWPEHPLHDEVLGFLQATRERASSLRARVDEHNARSGVPEESFRVLAYVGQTVIEREPGPA